MAVLEKVFLGGALAALLAAPALAQELGTRGLAPVLIAQAEVTDAEVAAEEADLDDAALLAEVLAALPPGVTLETATEAQIEAAVQTVIAAHQTGAAAPAGTGGAPATGTPGTSDARIAAVASRVLSVVSVSLQSIGRAAAADSVTVAVVAALPPRAQAQVRTRVAASLANPTPQQIAATALVIAQTRPAAGQQQQQQQVLLPIILPGQQSLGQSIFQENPNQVSPR